MSPTDVLAAHRIRKAYWDIWVCTAEGCEWRHRDDVFSDKPIEATVKLHAEHQLAEMAAAGHILTEAPAGPFKAEGFDFQGCTDRNPDNCACETDADVECERCSEVIEDGQIIRHLTRVMYPALPDGHEDQEWQTHVWHDDCTASAVQAGGQS